MSVQGKTTYAYSGDDGWVNLKDGGDDVGTVVSEQEMNADTQKGVVVVKDGAAGGPPSAQQTSAAATFALRRVHASSDIHASSSATTTADAPLGGNDQDTGGLSPRSSLFEPPAPHPSPVLHTANTSTSLQQQDSLAGSQVTVELVYLQDDSTPVPAPVPSPHSKTQPNLNQKILKKEETPGCCDALRRCFRSCFQGSGNPK